MSERYLVIGGNGFIGRALTSALRNLGHETLTLDITGNPDIKISINDRDGLLSINERFDGIFHLAAETSPPYFEINLTTGFQTNVVGTLNVFEFAKRISVPRVVIASSSAVYGNSSTPAIEKTIPDNYTSMYAVTKLFDEHLAKYYSVRNELECISLRYFNTYGPFENTKGIYSSQISKFVSAAINNRPIEIYGDGTQKRDFIYIKDNVQATINAFETGRPGESYNVGTGVSTDFNKIAQIVREETKSSSEILHIPNPLKTYQMFTQADMKKTETELNFKAKFDIRSGVRDMLMTI